MRRQLPPLNALKAFEAAARHLSISQAASELCVTPAAISHQIRLLEGHIGLPVFQRSGRNLVLTDAGSAFSPARCTNDARSSTATWAISNVKVRCTGPSSWAPR